MSFKSLLLVILLVGCFAPLSLYALSKEELEEKFDDNLELAKNAIANNETKKAMFLIKKNLSNKYFHLESYLFLANYHFDQKNYTKGFKVFHFMATKLHTSKLVKSPKVSDIESECEQVKKPGEEALEVYAQMGQKYFELADSDIFSEKFSQTLLIRSMKYYKIMNYYQYDQAETKYMLAILKNRLEDFQASLDFLLDSKEFYLSGESEDKVEQIENIKYLLGDNLIRSGFTDAGSLYLKSVFNSPNANSSLKEFASSYLDTLSESFFSFSVKFARSYDNNIHRLEQKRLDVIDNFPVIKNFLVSTDAWSNTLSANVLYNSKTSNNWSYFIYGDFENQTMVRSELSDKDSRTYSTSFEAKYNNFEKSLLKLNLSWTYTQYKENVGSSFIKLSNLYSIAPSWVYMLDKGSLSSKATFSITNSLDDGNLQEVSYSLTYKSFSISKWFAPSYSIEGGQLQEDSASEVSTKATLSFSNLSSINDNHSLSFSIDATINQNKTTSLAYNEANAGLTYTYLPPWLSGLALSLDGNYEYNKPKSSGVIKVLQYGASLSYNF